MKEETGKSEIIFRLAKYSFYLLIISVPLAITTITYNQSDLPKSIVLILLVSLIGIFITAGIFSDHLIGKKKKKEIVLRVLPLIDLPVILFLLAAVLSAVFSINRNISFYGQYERQIGLITYIFLFLLYLYSAVLADREEFTRKVVFFMELTAVIVSVYAILQQLGIDLFGLQPPTDSRPVTTIGNAVFAGGFLAIVLPLSAYNISGKKNKFLRIILPLIIIGGIIVTRTRSAYLAVAAEVIATVVILPFLISKDENRKKNYRKIIYLSFGALTAAIVLLLVVFPVNIFSERVFSIFSEGNNQRWTIWRDAFGVFWKYPIVGPGIGTFPHAFAEFYSYQLRYQDVMRFVDNAHNNYLQILFTMGTIGLLSYLSVLIAAFKICYRNIFNNETKTNNKVTGGFRLASAAIIISLAGYLVYGLTNFDEITIMLYFTILLVLLRMYSPGKKSIVLKFNNSVKYITVFLLLVVGGFSIACSYRGINNLNADMHFLKGEVLHKGNHFKEGIKEINTAVIFWPDNPVYRYTLALNVYTMINTNKNINEQAKNDLLRQAASELIKALKDHSNKNGCEALLSLIYYESGRIAEAEELKNKVLEGDAVNIMYRLNLAYYYINKNELSHAKEQLSAVDKINFQGMNRWFVEAEYYIAEGNKNNALTSCGKILEKEPYNPEAIELQKKANMLP